MRVTWGLVIIILIVSSCGTFRHSPVPATASRQEYIDAYSDIALREMQRTGIPASIKLAQAILESGDGNSTLARIGNNHFGIKCHDWTGRRIYHDDDERNECFRRYSHPEESFLDHSDFLTGRPRYGHLFQLDTYDYRGWARGLQSAGYATDPNYANSLIRIIEENELYQYDREMGYFAERRAAERRVTDRESDRTDGFRSREISYRNRIAYVTAREGDTFESLARQFGMKPWEFYLYNDLPREYSLRGGEIIYLQPKRFRSERELKEHVVSRGETMHCISQLYGIRLRWLLRRNDMSSDKMPEPGTVIKLR